MEVLRGVIHLSKAKQQFYSKNLFCNVSCSRRDFWAFVSCQMDFKDEGWQVQNLLRVALTIARRAERLSVQGPTITFTGSWDEMSQCD